MACGEGVMMTFMPRNGSSLSTGQFIDLENPVAKPIFQGGRMLFLGHPCRGRAGFTCRQGKEKVRLRIQTYNRTARDPIPAQRPRRSETDEDRRYPRRGKYLHDGQKDPCRRTITPAR